MDTTPETDLSPPLPLERSPAPVGASPYDRFAWLYDLVVGCYPYHRLAWGTSPRVHERFAREALGQCRQGDILDAGCGSLLFSARAYRSELPPRSRLTLLDGSASMLERGRRRLSRLGEDARISFRQGDICALPFADQCMNRVFHFGVLHCLRRPELALCEFRRVLEPRGELWLSCLVRGRPLGDRYLARLHRAGHVGAPRDVQEVLELHERQGLRVERYWLEGSLLFLRAAVRRSAGSDLKPG